jgi:hypothetical protein
MPRDFNGFIYIIFSFCIAFTREERLDGKYFQADRWYCVKMVCLLYFCTPFTFYDFINEYLVTDSHKVAYEKGLWE